MDGGGGVERERERVMNYITVWELVWGRGWKGKEEMERGGGGREGEKCEGGD